MAGVKDNVNVTTIPKDLFAFIENEAAMMGISMAGYLKTIAYAKMKEKKGG